MRFCIAVHLGAAHSRLLCEAHQRLCPVCVPAVKCSIISLLLCDINYLGLQHSTFELDNTTEKIEFREPTVDISLDFIFSRPYFYCSVVFRRSSYGTHFYSLHTLRRWVLRALTSVRSLWSCIETRSIRLTVSVNLFNVRWFDYCIWSVSRSPAYIVHTNSAVIDCMLFLLQINFMHSFACFKNGYLKFLRMNRGHAFGW